MTRLQIANECVIRHKLGKDEEIGTCLLCHKTGAIFIGIIWCILASFMYTEMNRLCSARTEYHFECNLTATHEMLTSIHANEVRLAWLGKPNDETDSKKQSESRNEQVVESNQFQGRMKFSSQLTLVDVCSLPIPQCIATGRKRDPIHFSANQLLDLGQPQAKQNMQCEPQFGSGEGTDKWGINRLLKDGLERQWPPGWLFV